MFNARPALWPPDGRANRAPRPARPGQDRCIVGCPAARPVRQPGDHLDARPCRYYRVVIAATCMVAPNLPEQHPAPMRPTWRDRSFASIRPVGRSHASTPSLTVHESMPMSVASRLHPAGFGAGPVSTLTDERRGARTPGRCPRAAGPAASTANVRRWLSGSSSDQPPWTRTKRASVSHTRPGSSELSQPTLDADQVTTLTAAHLVAEAGRAELRPWSTRRLGAQLFVVHGQFAAEHEARPCRRRCRRCSRSAWRTRSSASAAPTARHAPPLRFMPQQPDNRGIDVDFHRRPDEHHDDSAAQQRAVARGGPGQAEIVVLVEPWRSATTLSESAPVSASTMSTAARVVEHRRLVQRPGVRPPPCWRARSP